MSWERPYGPAIDVKELEYISALHQTALPQLRTDGSISATDVRLYLRSKYGIDFSHDIALEIVRGLGGPSIRVERIAPLPDDAKKAPGASLLIGAEKQYYFNLIHIVSIMFIPALLQAANDLTLDDADEVDDPAIEKDDVNVTHYPPNLLQHVAKIMVMAQEDDGSQTWNERLKKQYFKKLRGDEEEEATITERPAATVSQEFVRNLLNLCGERDDANNPTLVENMVQAAGGPGVLFDEHALGRALTSDVEDWEIGAENDHSTSFLDVFGFQLKNLKNMQKQNSSGNSRPDRSLKGQDAQKAQVDMNTQIEGDAETGFELSATPPLPPAREMKGIRVPQIVERAASIDRAVDTYDSLWLEVLLWMFYAFLSIVHAKAIKPLVPVTCTPGFFCNLYQAVLMFVFLGVFLSALGMVVIVPISMGSQSNSAVIRVLNILLCLAYASTPLYWKQFYYEETKLNTETDNLMGNVYPHSFRLAAYGAVALGCAVAVLLSVRLCPRTVFKRGGYAFFRGDDGRTAGVKLAAIHKLRGVMERSLNLHYDSGKSLKGSALNNFIMRGSAKRPIESNREIWKKLLNAELIYKDGIWIHSRLMVGQAGQIATMIFLIVIWLTVLRNSVDNARAKREAYADDPQVLHETPEPWMIIWSFIPGGIIALFAGYFIFISYIPSTVNTLLNLRTGVFPSLHDPNFFTYRKGADTIYLNLPNIIFAFLGSVVMFFVFYAGILFMCFYPPTQPKMSGIGATLCALFIIVFIKVFIMVSIRKRFWLAFFRRRPAEANFSSLILEAWQIGLAGSVLVLRIFFFIIAGAFWIGRVDQTFLAETVNYKGFRFDTAPINYFKELLVHDAHRHPFMERLGAMYMMRLKNGSKFSSDAGALWRNLFVVVLMPWMCKYRVVRSNEEEREDCSLEGEHGMLKEVNDVL